MDKFIATAVRKNIDGKPDYAWTYRYADGTAVQFDTESAALETARRKCANASLALYSPRAVSVQNHSQFGRSAGSDQLVPTNFPNLHSGCARCRQTEARSAQLWESCVVCGTEPIYV